MSIKLYGAKLFRNSIWRKIEIQSEFRKKLKSKIVDQLNESIKNFGIGAPALTFLWKRFKF